MLALENCLSGTVVLIYSKDLTEYITKLLILVPKVTYFIQLCRADFIQSRTWFPFGWGEKRNHKKGGLPGTQGTSGMRLRKHLLERECIQIWEYCWVFSVTLRGRGFVLDQQTLPVFLGQFHWPPLPNLLQAAAGNKWILTGWTSELLTCFLLLFLWQSQVCVDGKRHKLYLAHVPVIAVALAAWDSWGCFLWTRNLPQRGLWSLCTGL